MKAIVGAGAVCLMIITVLIACKGPEAKKPDSYYKGTIVISCDESFKPVMDQQVTVYEAQYPEVRIKVQYKPEADCLRDLTIDSVRMVIATRKLSENERSFITDSLLTDPRQVTIAHDLIAVIVHPSAVDTMFSMQEIRELLTGTSKKNLIPVFDGLKATSTVRFMLDSILKGEPLGPQVQAAPSSREVLDYVSKTPNAIGFVGFSWIGNSDDTAQLSYRKKVRLAWVESKDSVNFYVNASQYILYTPSYPMVRDLVYILKEKHTGLGHGFASFLESMRGQLIFRRAYIMPVIYPNYLREAKLQDTINKY